MEYELPEEFDLIVVGTGMVESVLSAAASRIGKRVLHLDRNDYYGGQWASFNLDSLYKLQQHGIKDETINKIFTEKEEFNLFGNELFAINNFTCKWSKTKISDQDDAETCDNTVSAEQKNIQTPEEEGVNIRIWDQQLIEKQSRKFNIDLAPKLQYARGELVELLISSNIARYSEYRSVSRVLVWLNGQLEIVPCSRSDVFSNNKVTVIEKRMLMKLFTSLDDEAQEIKKYENKTFREFLKDKKLTPNLIHYVLYAISMSNNNTTCYEGIASTKRFLNSLGRFGKTPFLFSMYGSGDITQAFCRLSAVFGGVFALGQTLHGFTVANNKFTSICVGKQRVRGDHLVMSVENAPEKYVQSVTKKCISRCILITNKSIFGSDKEHLTLLLYPPVDDKNAVTIIEMGTLTGTCPKDLYLVHLISSQRSSPHEDFKHVIENLFCISSNESSQICQDKPMILFSCCYSLPESNASNFENIPSNIFLCPGPDIDLDYDISIKKAKEIFQEIYPDQEFLPRAPDPEEIIIEGEDEIPNEEDAEQTVDEGGDTKHNEINREENNMQHEDIKEKYENEEVVKSETVNQENT